jgi:hypothetical protein
MAKTLIMTPFPSTAEVARELGLPDSRIRRVAALMGMNPSEGSDGKVNGTHKKNPSGRVTRGDQAGGPSLKRNGKLE